MSTASRVLQFALGLMINAAFIGVIALVATTVVPQENRELFLTLCSQLSGGWLVVVGFAFGSSMGSQAKDAKALVQAKEP